MSSTPHTTPPHTTTTTIPPLHTTPPHPTPQAALERDIQATLTEWSPLLANTDLIFVHAPAVNGNAVFAGPNAPLKLSDPRVRKVPFIVRRPTFSEAKRVVHQLLQVCGGDWVCKHTHTQNTHTHTHIYTNTEQPNGPRCPT